MKFSTMRSERLRLVLGSLIFQFLKASGVPFLIGKVATTYSDETYDVGKSKTLGRVYKQVDIEEDDKFITS